MIKNGYQSTHGSASETLAASLYPLPSMISSLCRLAGSPGKPVAALALLVASSANLATCDHPARADPYDKGLEARVEALEKELKHHGGRLQGQKTWPPRPARCLLFCARRGKEVQETDDLGRTCAFATTTTTRTSSTPAAATKIQRSRYVFRLRLNLNYTMSDNWYVAVGVADQWSNPIAQNQAITEGFDDYGIYLHQFILGYKATPWATIIMGKLFAPFL